MSKRNPELREYALTLAHGPNGLTTDDLIPKFGLTRKGAWSAINRLSKTIKLYRVSETLTFEQRWFASAEEMTRWVARNADTLVRKAKKRGVAFSITPAGRRRHKVFDDNAEAIVPSTVKVTVAPPFVDRRFAAEPGHVGEFSALGIGCYVDGRTSRKGC